VNLGYTEVGELAPRPVLARWSCGQHLPIVVAEGRKRKEKEKEREKGKLKNNLEFHFSKENKNKRREIK